MRFTDGTIKTFQEIMKEFFYDWHMTQDPQIKQSPEGFWINKTSLFLEDGKYYLTYKTDNFEVEPQAFNDFSRFYHDLYVGDSEFEKSLGEIEDNMGEIAIESDQELTIGKVSFVAKNFKYYQKNNQSEVEISKRTFLKVKKFWEMMKG